MPEVELNDSLESGIDAKGYSSFVAQIDLVEEGPTGKPPRLIVVCSLGSGVLNITTRHGARAALPFVVGMPIPLAVLSIDTGTNVGSILVVW